MFRPLPLLLALIAPALAMSAPGNNYDGLRSAAVDRCKAIDPAAYQTGLIFNPEGYRSYYVRSKCFQEAAVEFRDGSLCREVRQRHALFSSSWGYTPSRCRQLVQDALAKDRAELEEMKSLYARGGIEWRDFVIERNGNGRDFDIIPSFEGRYAHGYRLTFEILPDGQAGAPVTLHSDGYYVDATNTLRIYVRQADIRQRFAGFTLGRPYRVRATIALEVGTGGLSARWSDRFIEGVFPLRDRFRTMTKQVTF